jgi:pyruvate dehydrogenase E2 component (dihydrolipoamide acetyltransferase)
LGVDWRQAAPTGPRGQIKERDVKTFASQTARQEQLRAAPEAFQITPVARRLAESMGIDIPALSRQHLGKRLDRADVEQALREAVQAAKSLQLSFSERPPVDIESPREPASALRLLISERMSTSAHTTAPVTLTTKADATELVKFRVTLKSDPRTDVLPSYNVLMAGLVARALVEHPILNASYDGNEIVYRNTVNIGIAVDTERGLVVPVLRDVQKKTIRALAGEAEELLNRASLGKAMPDDLNGSTFTITNLGMFEIDAFTPIINLPECAVLGIGRFAQEVIPLNDQSTIRTMVTLSLTFDHRLVDGAPAARFLQRIKQFVEQPYLWLG